jgi:TRAP-type C4-dicarboxylate transport system permease small subunit
MTHLVRAARPLKRGLDQILGAVMLLLLGSIIALVLLQISARFLPFIRIQWTEEMSRYLFVYLTFIGAALLIKEKGHIVVDVLVDRLPSRLRLAVYLVVQATVLGFLYLFVSGVLTLAVGSMGTRASSMTWFSMGYLYWGVWLGGVLMIFYSCLELGGGTLRLLGRRNEAPQ